MFDIEAEISVNDRMRLPEDDRMCSVSPKTYSAVGKLRFSLHDGAFHLFGRTDIGLDQLSEII